MANTEFSEINQFGDLSIKEFGSDPDKVIRFWRDDSRLKALVVSIKLSIIGLLLLLTVPIWHFLSANGLNIPVVSRAADWLSSGSKLILAAGGLVLFAALAFVVLRYLVLRNPFFYVEEGCPQCLEKDLIRVRRHRMDRVLSAAGIPVQRHVCRNCSWDGLRLGGSHHTHAMLEAESTDYQSEFLPENGEIAHLSESNLAS